MKKLYIIISLVFVILAGFFYISLRLNLDEFVQKTFSLKQTDKDNDIATSETPEPENQQSREVQESSGEESQIQGEAGKTQDDCAQTIAYTMLDFSEQKTCNTYQGQNCINKTINCSAHLQNLDPDLGGDFTVRFDYNDHETGEIISSLTETQYISPRQTLQFSKIKNFQPPDANKNMDCRFSTENAPTRIIC